jgi:magnesium chelatase subunit I
MKKIQGLLEKISVLGGGSKPSPSWIASAGEFLLEGLYSHRRISRSEERGFVSEEKKAPSPVREEFRPPHRRPYN